MERGVVEVTDDGLSDHESLPFFRGRLFCLTFDINLTEGRAMS